MTKDRKKLLHLKKVNQRHTEQKGDEKGNDKEASPSETEKKEKGSSSQLETRDGVVGASGFTPKQQRERVRGDRRRVGEVQQPNRSEGEVKKPEEVKPKIDGETKAETESERRYAKRQIFSNWEQYDLPVCTDDRDDEYIQSADFSELLNAPLSEGGHFRFKTERTWDEDRTAFCSEFFSLDLKQLANGLLSIPFYKRIGLPSEYFQEAEIQKMEEDSKRCLEFTSTSQTVVQRVLDILTEPSSEQMYLEEDKDDEQVEAVWALTEDPGLEETPDEFAETEDAQKKTSEVTVVSDERVSKENFTIDFKEELARSREGTPKEKSQERTIKVKSCERTLSHVKPAVNKDGGEMTPIKTEAKKELPVEVLPSTVNSKTISSGEKANDGDDDLDFLLTLKAPVAETRELLVNNLAANSEVEKELLDDSNKEEETSAVCLPSANAAVKSQSLEDWLDTILDD